MRATIKVAYLISPERIFIIVSNPGFISILHFLSSGPVPEQSFVHPIPYIPGTSSVTVITVGVALREDP